MLPVFRNFKENIQAFGDDRYASLSWWPAWFGYFAMAMSEYSGSLLERSEVLNPGVVLLVSISLALTIGAASHALGVGGLWLWLGAKIVGGRKGFSQTIKLVGYAFYWPGLMVLPALIIENFTLREEAGTTATVLGLVALLWHVVIAIWGWLRMINAVRLFHELTFWKAVFIGLWPLAIAIPLMLAFILIATL